MNLQVFYALGLAARIRRAARGEATYSYSDLGVSSSLRYGLLRRYSGCTALLATFLTNRLRTQLPTWRRRGRGLGSARVLDDSRRRLRAARPLHCGIRAYS